MRQLLLCFIVFACTHSLMAAGPVAKNDSVTLFENSQINIAVTANDSNTNGGPLTVAVVFPPTNAITTVNGTSILYQPQNGYLGADSFMYSICDTLHQCSRASVYVNVIGSNHAPVVVDDSYTFADTVTVATLNVLMNDLDPGNDTLYIGAVVALDSSSTLAVLGIDSGAKTISFTHTVQTCGTAVFQYTVCNINKCDTGLITINVTCPDSVFLPRGFSPNGDGKNDKLVFTGLEYFSPAMLNVFNRYGSTVYQNANYLNDWDGTDMDSHNALPDGTYFYILTLPGGTIYNNYVVINR